MRRWRKYRHKFWVHALIVGVLLTGQIHLFTAEIIHHHNEDTRVCKIEHRGGTYLHAAPEISPLCPLCQVVRNGSVRPAVQSHDSQAGPGIRISADNSDRRDIPPTSRYRFLPAPLLSPESFASFQFEAKILMSLKEEIHV